MSSPSRRTYSWSQIHYSLSSFHAIVTPVAITMILSALSVLYVSTQESRALTEQAFSRSYTVFSADSSSISMSLGKSLVNSIVIVSVIAAMTFVIVLLYKFNCMKLLWTYMIASSALLLGFLGSQYLLTGLIRYRIPLDKVTFYYWVCNFCIVGVLVIFFAQHQKSSSNTSDSGHFLISLIGSPRYFTQAYLIATAVILAWQLSNFEEWTTWTLLVLLAIYDLCAVLTPCGPLKLLVGLMQRDNAPSLPGLLYEAPLPSRGGAVRQSSTPGHSTNSTTNELPSRTRPMRLPESTPTTSSTHSSEEWAPSSLDTTPHISSERIPLAIARVYTLPVLQAPPDLNHRIESEWIRRRLRRPSSDLPIPFSPSELVSLVQVQFPPEGGRIIPLLQDEPTQRLTWLKFGRERRPQRVHYQVVDRHGIIRRILTVDDSGQVLQLRSDHEQEDEEEEEDPHSSSIKLGLGDFIFYSVLVAKAVLYSFTTFASCVLVILAGLGSTLLLLSVYHKALPALPISIFLGVIFYLLTRLVMEPWIQAIMTTPLFV